MKVETKKESILKAHENGCQDVKNVLENLYPDVFEKKYDENYFYSFGESGDNIITRIGYKEWAAVAVSDTNAFYGNRYKTLKECIDHYGETNEIIAHVNYNALLKWLSRNK